MSNAALPAMFAAAALAMVGAIFGVFIARLTWDEDLEHAKRIDAIRTRTEISLKNTIISLEEQIKIIEKGLKR